MRLPGYKFKLLLLLALALLLIISVFSPAVLAVNNTGVVENSGQDYSFLPFPHFVIVDAEPEKGGTVEGQGEFYAEVNTTVRAIPAEGYYFINWTENGKEVSRSAEYSFRVTKDRFLTANFSTDQYTPPVIVPGDVNGDGVIDIKDVTLVMRHVLDLHRLDKSGKEAADVNGDDVIDIKDVTLIMRRALNIIDKFPVDTGN